MTDVVDEKISKREYTLAEIHDQSFEERVTELMARDIERLQEFSPEFTDVPCPACLSEDNGSESKHLGFNYKRCGDCGLLFISPGPTNAHTLWFLEHSEGLRHWRDSMPTAVRERRIAMYQERASYILNVIKEFEVGNRSLLEIGAGNGEFALALLEQDANCFDRIVLCEPQPIKVKHSKVSIVNDSIQDGTFSGNFDLVVSFEVLEHIPDPTTFLLQARELLAERGVLVLSTPNEKSLEMRLLKALSSNISFDHVRFYNPHSVSILLERFGFDVLQIETPGLLDVEMIQRQFELGKLDLEKHPLVRFFLEEGSVLKEQLQDFLRREKMSSHMRVIARRKV